VRDHQHRLAGLRLRPQQFQDLDSRAEIQLTRRLVGEQDRVAGG
jgi:predicted component of type VI protein secretion system